MNWPTGTDLLRTETIPGSRDTLGGRMITAAHSLRRGTRSVRMPRLQKSFSVMSYRGEAFRGDWTEHPSALPIVFIASVISTIATDSLAQPQVEKIWY